MLAFYNLYCIRDHGRLSVCLQIFEWVKEHGGEPIIPFSGILEAKIFDMPDDEKATYLKEVSVSPSCLLHSQQVKAILTVCA